MNKKGFTLVELLAVIVILALLALLTSTAVTKLVKDAKNDLSDTQIQLIKSAADTWVADNLNNLPSSGSCGYLTLQDLKYYGLLDNVILDPKNNEEISNDLKIKITTTTSAYGNPVTKAEVNPESIEGCEPIYNSSCYAVEGDGSNVGDKIACEIGDTPEYFYVISNDGSSIQMLTEKNIHTTEYRQSDNAGTVVFSTKSYWKRETAYPLDVYDERNDVVKPIVDNYVSYLNIELTGATGSLLTYSQAENLGCIADNNSCAPRAGAGGGTAPSWLYLTTYWLGSTYDVSLWIITSSGVLNTGLYSWDEYYGVRPVITIPVAELR